MFRDSGGLTCMDGFRQPGLVLRGQQGLVITRVALQSLLCAARCHPDPGPVLPGHTFTHVPFHFQSTSHWWEFGFQVATGRRNQRVFVPHTRHVLLHVRPLLQELGPPGGPPGDHGRVLLHHLLVGVHVVTPLEAVGVNPAGVNEHSAEAMSGGARRSTAGSRWSPGRLLPADTTTTCAGEVFLQERSHLSAEWSAPFNRCPGSGAANIRPTVRIDTWTTHRSEGLCGKTSAREQRRLLAGETSLPLAVRIARGCSGRVSCHLPVRAASGAVGSVVHHRGCKPAAPQSSSHRPG